MHTGPFFQPIVTWTVACVPAGSQAALRTALARRLRVGKRHLPERIEQALTDIEAGRGRYVWAFDTRADAESMQRLSKTAGFRAFPQPASMEEAGIHVLSELFPPGCRRVIEVAGEGVCCHPYVQIGGAGSIRAVPRAIKRADWLDWFCFGVGRLWLVRCT